MAQNAAPTIEAHGLTKQYGSEKKGLVHALAGLDLIAPAGKVTAILGPNGAGTTTFVKAVATLLKPDSGSLRVAGIDAIATATFSWLQISLGLIAGSPQAAQGIGFSVFPLIFVSSAYVPVESMPGWLQPFAENQPVTAMVGSVRALVLGGDTEALLGHSTTWFVARSLTWSVLILVVFATLSTRKFTKL